MKDELLLPIPYKPVLDYEYVVKPCDIGNTPPGDGFYLPRRYDAYVPDHFAGVSSYYDTTCYGGFAGIKNLPLSIHVY